ncbi:MAG TPA: 6-bladed beta-propeller [Longimicrobiales bacterium]
MKIRHPSGQKLDTARKRRIQLFAMCMAIAACSNGKTEQFPGDPIQWPAQTSPASAVSSIDVSAMETAPVLRPGVALTLGGSAADPKNQFSVVRGVDVDQAGRIYVLDSYAYRVRVYDRNGTFIRDIGRRGEGPGEFSRLRGPQPFAHGNGVAVVGDTLWVIDGQSLEAFALNGDFLTATPPQLNMFDAYSLKSTDQGLVVARTLFVDGNSLTLSPALYDPVGQSLSEGFRLRYTLRESKTDNASPTLAAPIPLPSLFFDIARDGSVLLTVGDSFHVRRLAFGGRISNEVLAAVHRRLVSSQDIDEYVSAQFSRMSAMSGPPGTGGDSEDEKVYKRRLRAHPRAHYREAIRRLIISDRNELLLRRSDIVDHPYRTDDATAIAEWTWIDESGRPVARVLLPSSFTPKQFRKCELYGTDEAPDGAQLVSKFSLGGPHCQR